MPAIVEPLPKVWCHLLLHDQKQPGPPLFADHRLWGAFTLLANCRKIFSLVQSY